MGGPGWCSTDVKCRETERQSNEFWDNIVAARSIDANYQAPAEPTTVVAISQIPRDADRSSYHAASIHDLIFASGIPLGQKMSLTEARWNVRDGKANSLFYYVDGQLRVERPSNGGPNWQISGTQCSDWPLADGGIMCQGRNQSGVNVPQPDGLLTYGALFCKSQNRPCPGQEASASQIMCSPFISWIEVQQSNSHCFSLIGNTGNGLTAFALDAAQCDRKNRAFNPRAENISERDPRSAEEFFVYDPPYQGSGCP